MKKEFLFTIIALAVFIVLLSLLFIFSPNPREELEPQSLPDNYVTRVIDGDTFVINSGETIRLLCVDTPEKNTEGYEDATLFLEDLILNKEVTLNSSITDKDIYGRLLRYVYINGTFVNKEILQNDYGKLLIIPPEDCTEVK